MTAAVCDAVDGGRCVLYAGHRGEHLYRRSAAGAPFKLCPRCGVAQSLATQFQARADGSVFSWCKGCNRAYSRERRAASLIGASTPSRVKVVGLSYANRNALEECADRLPSMLELTATTATFTSAPVALAEVEALVASLPGRGHPRASLHAVRRRLEATL